MRLRQSFCLAGVMALVLGVLPTRLPAAENKPTHHRYKFVDLGTFGGPDSIVPFYERGIITRDGRVVGGADTSIPDPYFPNCFSPNCVIQHAFEWEDGVLTDLEALPGTNNSFSIGVNELGWVAGASQNGRIDPLSGTPEIHAVLWINGRIHDLGTLGGNQSATFGLNNNGQGTGVALNRTPDPWGLVCPCGTQNRAFLWQDGVMHSLGTLGGPDSYGQSINDRGHVAGASFTNDTANSATGIPTVNPFFWDGKKMWDLGTLGGAVGQVNDLNNLDQVIGTSSTADAPGACLGFDAGCHAFLWQPGWPSMKDLGTLGGALSVPVVINNAGLAVGVSTTNDETVHAVAWKNESIHDLGIVPGDFCSWAWGVNNRNQVVGISLPLPCDFSVARAFLWEDGEMIDLNTRIPSGSSLQLVYAEAINDRGEITGIGVPAGVSPMDVESQGHAFVLIPLDETDDVDSAAIPGEVVGTEADRRTATANAIAKMREALAKHHHFPRK
jgi:probable HAF family extracellular repeat protein